MQDDSKTSCEGTKFAAMWNLLFKNVLIHSVKNSVQISVKSDKSNTYNDQRRFAFNIIITIHFFYQSNEMEVRNGRV